MGQIYKAVDFFAGSGLVSLGLRPHFEAVWANDIDASKSRIYKANFPQKKFVQDDIRNLKGAIIPPSDIAWASFPCQDLSLAGKMQGIKGDQSGLVWEWIRILKEMPQSPSMIVAENVLGLLTANRGQDYLVLHQELSSAGYSMGVVVLNAREWLPQSRVRVFLIGLKSTFLSDQEIISFKPTWCHPEVVLRLAAKTEKFIFWNLPVPASNPIQLFDIVDRSIPCPLEYSSAMLRLIPYNQMERIKTEILDNPHKVYAGYRRTRSGGQRLEIRFDDCAGCLRTAKGGSSKQILVYQKEGELVARFMSPREAARAMGAPEHFQLLGSMNEAYSAMGDAVAVPVTNYLATHLLKPILDIVYERNPFRNFA